MRWILVVSWGVSWALFGNSAFLQEMSDRVVASEAIFTGNAVESALPTYEDRTQELLSSSSALDCLGCDYGCCDSGCCYRGCCSSGCCDGPGGLFGSCGQLFGNCGGLFGKGWIKRSDRCFDDFISPMTNPVFFEDPRTLTEVRFIFIHHRLPTALGGNSIQGYAPQVRVALSERLSLIMTKGSVIYSQSPLLDSGFLDMAGGFKYNLLRDPEAGRLLSVGMTFEAPTGSTRSLQGNGDGEFHFFATGGTRVGSRSHWLSAVGLRQPVDEQAENRLMHWSNHFDYRLGSRPLYAFTEVNWFHYLSDGAAFPFPIEGGDIFNFGSVGVASNNLVTQAVGLKSKPKNNMELGVAFEYPVSPLRGIMRNRLTFDCIVRY